MTAGYVDHAPKSFQLIALHSIILITVVLIAILALILAKLIKFKETINPMNVTYR